MLITDTNIELLNILRVLQLCDSNFPIGSFNHSFGMETYLRDGVITDKKSLKNWLMVYLLNQFTTSEGLGFKLTYEALSNNNLEYIWQLDRTLTVQNIAKESRDGTKLIAYRMINMILDLYEVPLLDTYKSRILNKESFGHPAIAFAILMNHWNIPSKDALVFYIYSTTSTLIQNAVRTIPLGQKDGQTLLKELFDPFYKVYEVVNELKEEDLGANIPGLELSQINHETLIFRLFMS